MKLIDKDALVAEIERRQKIHFNDYHINRNNSPADYGACNALTQILSFINTLEVKEVDLQSEIDRVWDNTSDNFSEDDWKEFEDVAKHFFELGLNSSNLLTWEDIRLIAEIGDKFMNSEESDNLSEEDYYKEILNRFKAQKGEEI